MPNLNLCYLFTLAYITTFLHFSEFLNYNLCSLFTLVSIITSLSLRFSECLTSICYLYSLLPPSQPTSLSLHFSECLNYNLCSLCIRASDTSIQHTQGHRFYRIEDMITSKSEVPALIDDKTYSEFELDGLSSLSLDFTLSYTHIYIYIYVCVCECTHE